MQSDVDRPIELPRRHVFRYWVWEVGGMILALGLMGTIIGLLVYHDGKELSSGILGLNLTTIIAFLSTMLRALMVTVVGELLSQIKWGWFLNRSQPMSDLQDFDSASRGMYGAFQLISMLVARTLEGAAGGAGMAGVTVAFVGVTSFTIGPFIQQALKTSTCSLAATDANAGIPVAYYVKGSSVQGAYAQPLPQIQGLINQALINPLSTDFPIRPLCGTGNCTFPDYGTGITHTSIGLCSNCSDSSSMVLAPDNLPAITWLCHKKGHNMTIINPLGPFRGDSSSWDGIGNHTVISMSSDCTRSMAKLPDHAAAYMELYPQTRRDFNILALSEPQCHKPNGTGHTVCVSDRGDMWCSDKPDYCASKKEFVAFSCSVYPCLKSYYGFVANGILKERVVSTVELVPNVTQQVWKDEQDKNVEGTPDDPDYDYSSEYNLTVFHSPCLLNVPGRTTGPSWYTKANISSALLNATNRHLWPTVYDIETDRNITVPEECEYTLDKQVMMSLHQTLSQNNEGECYIERSSPGKGTAAIKYHLLLCSPDQNFWLKQLFDDGDISLETVSTAMDALTTALTNKFRAVGYGPDKEKIRGEREGKGFQVQGVAIRTAVCTYVDWRWLLLPCVLISLTAVQLVWTLVSGYRERRQPVWKSNILPLLFHRFTNTELGLPPENMDLSVMEARAQKIEIQFHIPGKEEEQVLKLVGAEPASYSMDSLLVVEEQTNSHET